MKNILFILLFFVGLKVSAQVDISNTATNAAVELNVVSPNNNSGVLIPKLTTAQMTAISSPTNGLLVFNTDVGTFMYNAGDGGSPIWTIVGQVPAIDITTITGSQGDIRFNTVDSKVYFYNGSAWIELVAP